MLGESKTLLMLMQRFLYLAFLIAFISCEEANQVDQNDQDKQVDHIREQLKKAWQRSEEYSLSIVNQMPEEGFSLRSTPETMTYAEQWRHCVLYTCSQLSGNLAVKNPYADRRLPVQMPKKDVVNELKHMYAFVLELIETTPDSMLLNNIDFAGDHIPGWRLFYAMDNHIIHHRGQCIVYLRLQGITPKGYYGW